jgi:transposase-like protein
MQTAIHHAPNHPIRKRTGAELRAVWNANSLAAAQIALTTLVNASRDTAPKLADWLERNISEGLTVFTLPEPHQRRLRTSNPMERGIQQELKRRTTNPMERGIQQELKRRTTKIRVFPNEAALERLVSAVLVEIDEKWAADTKAYIKWDCQDA